MGLRVIGLGDCSPCNDTRERGIRPGDAQECPKVFRTDGSLGNVDGEANRAKEKTSKDKRPTQPQLIRKVGEEQQNNRWKGVIVGIGWRSNVGVNLLATAYGGTVRRFETATEYPKPRMIEGKKSEIP